MSSSTSRSAPAQGQQQTLFSGTPGSDTPTQLPQGYHLRNFFTLVDYVHATYEDLLTPADLAFIRQFRALDRASQSLYVRLCMRKGPLFRSDSLVYEDIADLPTALQQLADHQLIEEQPAGHPVEVLNLLRKPELETLARESGLNTGPLRKDALVTAIMAALDSPSVITAIAHQIHWIKRQQDTVVRRFKLLFFGNARQDFSEFITSQLGIVRYEDYAIDHSQRFFQDATRLHQLESLTDIQQQLDEATDTPSTDDLLTKIAQINGVREQAAAVGDHYIHHKAERMITRMARQLERLSPEAALDCYRFSLYPPSRERQARLLEKQGKDSQALTLIAAAETRPEHPDEPESLQALKKKLHRKLGKPLPTPLPSLEYPSRVLKLPREDGAIEYQVARHLCEQEGLCLPLENQLFCGLFGLYFWDIIFSPQADAFFNPYQFGPRDLWSDAFYLKRQGAIDERLHALQDSTPWRETLLHHCQHKTGIANYFVNWQLFDEALVERLCDHIPAAHLRAVFTKMLEHPGYYRNGFPDLILLTTKGYALWEVKGPTDTLQNNQKRWLTYFQQHGIPAGVLNVEWLP